MVLDRAFLLQALGGGPRMRACSKMRAIFHAHESPSAPQASAASEGGAHVARAASYCVSLRPQRRSRRGGPVVPRGSSASSMTALYWCHPISGGIPAHPTATPVTGSPYVSRG